MPDSRAALAALYDAAAPAVYGFLLRMVRDAAWAEDLLQETFLRVAPHLERLPDADAVRGYLWRSASNLALDGLRRRGRLASVDLSAHPEPADPAPSDGLLAAEAREDRARLRAEVEALPPRERAAVLLRVSAHLAFREVGEAMGITDRGAARLYEAGVARLRARLSPADHDDADAHQEGGRRMLPTDADFERSLEEALGPVAPPERARRAVLGAAHAPSRMRRATGILLPYAAGLLTALLLRAPAEPAPVPVTPPSYESIADREPPPPPEEETPPAVEPLPRIS